MKSWKNEAGTRKLRVASWLIIGAYFSMLFFGGYDADPLEILLGFFLSCIILLGVPIAILFIIGNRKHMDRQDVHYMNAALIIYVFYFVYLCLMLYFSEDNQDDLVSLTQVFLIWLLIGINIGVSFLFILYYVASLWLRKFRKRSQRV